MGAREQTPPPPVAQPSETDITHLDGDTSPGANVRHMSDTKRRGTTRGLAAAYLNDRVKTGQFSRNTAKDYAYVLHGFCEVAPHHADQITRRTVVRYMGQRQHLSAATRRHYYKAVHGFTEWLLARRVLRADPFRDVPKPKEARIVHHAFNDEQTRLLLAVCVDPRDRCMVMLGLHAGLRRAELAGLEVGDVSLVAKTVRVVDGKGGDGRLLPLADEACRAVASYLAVAGHRAGPLLRNRRAPERGLTPRSVGFVMARLCRDAGIKVRGFDGVGTHALRHTCATDVYEQCHDLLAVRDLLGHRNSNTTDRYVRRLNVERMRVAVEGRRYAA